MEVRPSAEPSSLTGESVRTEEAGRHVWQLTEYLWELMHSKLDPARRLWASLFDV